jgi:membrane-bound lytic murein transglycosylase B
MMHRFSSFSTMMAASLLCAAFLLAIFPASAGDFSHRDDVDAFISKMVKDHQFDRKELTTWLDSAEKKQSILDAIAKPAEKEKTWKDYRAIFLTDERINFGVQFWHDNAATLDAVSKHYGVPPEMIVAILGIETRYGRNTGNYRVIDALATLGFDYPPRGKFFQSQLEEFFLLAREQHHDPLDLKGSYAGAMGYGQFMPSSYRHFAVDYNGDHFADIWTSPDDVIASVANYFRENGWQSGQPVVSRCRTHAKYDESVADLGLKPKLQRKEIEQKGFFPVEPTSPDELFAVYKLEGENGTEFWCGAMNFYVITRYNTSNMYALAAYQLGQEIRNRYLGKAAVDWGT